MYLSHLFGIMYYKVGDKMAKKFVFDDENLEIIDRHDDVHSSVNTQNQMNDEIKEVENKNLEKTIVVSKDEIFQTEELEEDLPEEKESMLKRVLHMKWRWWHYILFGLIVLCILFAVYIYSVTNTDGPVYGNRCEGVVAIPIDAKTSTIENMTKEYQEIESLEIEVVCKQIKFDITFKSGTKTKKAISIAETVVKSFDEEAGIQKDEEKTYSNLFGSIDNEPQYDINVCLICEDNKDFPVYGTKHTQRDKITYTYASIKDQESYDKAVSTLDEK